MLPNPCPCSTLQCGVKAVAVFQAVFDLPKILIFTAILCGLNASDNFLLGVHQETSHPTLIVLLIDRIVALGFDIVLYLGAKKRNSTMCWVWLGFALVHFLYSILFFILVLSGVVVYAGTRGWDVYDTIAKIIDTAIVIYLLFVVYAFIIKLRNQPDPQLNPANQVSTMAQPQGSVYGAMEAGTYYTAEQPNYPMESQPLNQPQPTSTPAL